MPMKVIPIIKVTKSTVKKVQEVSLYKINQTIKLKCSTTNGYAN